MQSKQIRCTYADVHDRYFRPAAVMSRSYSPLPVSTALTITFWLDSEKVVTADIVRTCDGGVGMGIEFTGLTEDTEKRLQLFIEKLEKAAEAILDS